MAFNGSNRTFRGITTIIKEEPHVGIPAYAYRECSHLLQRDGKRKVKQLLISVFIQLRIYTKILTFLQLLHCRDYMKIRSEEVERTD